jgi:N-acyl-D-amino-acid deacylase
VISFPGPFDGRSVADAAEDLSLPPAEALLRVIVDSGAEAEALFFGMSEENLVKVLGKPYVMVASDSSARPFPSAGRAHPRSYGTFPRALSRYSAPCGLGMEEVVNKMTGMPAARLGLQGRGLLREGSFADVTVFSPEELRDAATYEEPEKLSEGIRLVIVNGELVWKDGRLTGKFPGRVLRKG